MPALLRPSLRSSSRKNTSLGEVPPTDIQQNPLPKSRRGKRNREHSLDNSSNASVKKQKCSPPKQSEQAQGAGKTQSGKSLPVRDKPGTKDAVTSRPGSDRSQQRINGNPTATQHLNGSTFGTNNHLVYTTTKLVPTDKRSLRSHDGGSRSKSELALYFPNYDELVSIEPKEPGMLPIDP